jgi:hypothetical protein
MPFLFQDKQWQVDENRVIPIGKKDGTQQYVD